MKSSTAAPADLQDRSRLLTFDKLAAFFFSSFLLTKKFDKFLEERKKLFRSRSVTQFEFTRSRP